MPTRAIPVPLPLQLMSVACLYLGGKVEDTPKSVRDVLVASCELRYGLEAARRISHDKVRPMLGRTARHTPALKSRRGMGWQHSGLRMIGRRAGAARQLYARGRHHAAAGSRAGRAGRAHGLAQLQVPGCKLLPALQALYESLREKVFIAERALLYALDFDFAVQHAAKVGLYNGSSCTACAPQLGAAAREVARHCGSAPWLAW